MPALKNDPLYQIARMFLWVNSFWLGKQNHAAPIDNYNPGPQLVAALKCLGQQIENELAFEEPSTILQYAWNNWDIARITNATEIEFC